MKPEEQEEIQQEVEAELQRRGSINSMQPPPANALAQPGEAEAGEADGLNAVASINDQAMPNENSATLDILLVPEPRELLASDFVPHNNGDVTEKELHDHKHAWEYFDLDQNWISDGVKKTLWLRTMTHLATPRPSIPPG